MKKLFVLVFLALFIQSSSFGQAVYPSTSGIKGYKKKPAKKGYDPSKLVIGSGINFGLGGGFANFGISPKIGYKFNKYIAAGVGLGYQYYKAPYSDYFTNIYNREHIVYPSLWAKAPVWGPWYLATDLEYNVIFLNGYSDGIDPSTNLPWKLNTTLTGPALLVGGGYKYEMGGKFSSTAELLYDVIQNENLPQYYQQLVFRIGFFVNF